VRQASFCLLEVVEKRVVDQLVSAHILEDQKKSLYHWKGASCCKDLIRVR